MTIQIGINVTRNENNADGDNDSDGNRESDSDIIDDNKEEETNDSIVMGMAGNNTFSTDERPHSIPFPPLSMDLSPYYVHYYIMRRIAHVTSLFFILPPFLLLASVVTLYRYYRTPT